MTTYIKQHFASNYYGRTKANVEAADLTVAFAADYKSAGEQLTAKLAGKKYIAIPISTCVDEAATLLINVIKAHNAKNINIAGNGIYTLTKHGYTQDSVNTWMYEVLSKVHKAIPLSSIRSGGQTGVDIAGIIAARALNITAIALFPAKYLQRSANGHDLIHTSEEIKQQILSGVGNLSLLRDIHVT